MSGPPLPEPPEDRLFHTGARRDSAEGKPRLDYLPWHALRSLGAYMLEKSERFGPCNYRRGMPLSELNASMLRHVAEYQTAESHTDEIAALHGVLFNASVSLEQLILGRDDLNDMSVIRYGATGDVQADAQVQELVREASRKLSDWPDDEADVHSVRTQDAIRKERRW